MTLTTITNWLNTLIWETNLSSMHKWQAWLVQMLRILIATAKLAPGASYTARTPRHPRMLLPRLAERGLAFEVYDEPDGSALVHVRRPA